MVERGVATYIEFYVISPSTGKPAGGLASNITAYLSKDFETCDTTSALTVTESDVITGLYIVNLTTSQMDADYITVCPSCNGYCIRPITLSTKVAQRKREFTVPFYVYRTDTGEGISGLAGDGTPLTSRIQVYLAGHSIYPMNTNLNMGQATNPVHEVDPTNAPGLYTIQLTNNEMYGTHLIVYPVPESGHASPVVLEAVDAGAELINDIDASDHAYDWLRYNLDQIRASENRIMSYLANYNMLGDRITFFDCGGNTLDTRIATISEGEITGITDNRETEDEPIRGVGE